MTIPLIYILKYKFPEYDTNDISKLQLSDHGNGVVEISVWGFDDPKPTHSQIQEWGDAPMINAKYISEMNQNANAGILDQLQVLDARSIRPLREGDVDKIHEIEEQAITLRQQLLPTGIDEILQQGGY